ncbi:MAG: transglycosylase SLT domain-containing protein [Pyrinomonadaceae bacterium]
MFAPLALAFIACFSALSFTPACDQGRQQHTLAPEATSILFEPMPANLQGDAALVSARRLDRDGRLANGQLAPLPASEHIRRAAVYLANRAFGEAREHWQALVSRYPNDANVPAALFGMGRSLYVERRYAEALPYFERLGQNFLDQKDGREGYYYVAATVLRMDQPARAAVRYGEYAERFPQGERVENAYLNAIDSWREAGRNEEAVRWVDQTRVRFKGTATETNALFARLRLDVSVGDWSAAVRSADELRARPFGAGAQTTLPEVLYLRAYSLERAGQTQAAIEAYKAVGDRLSSYFGARATERLESLGPDGRRASLARQAGARREASAAAGNYPVPFRESILRAVKDKNVDARLVLAIMRQESSFRPDARSQAAARGLLQLTVDAATKYAPAAGIKTFDENDLYRPEINIPLGVAYLADLFRQFPGLPEAVAASYNGGEDNVARWVARAGQKDNGVFTSEIGFTESKDYAMKVLANYRAYKLLYTPDLRRQR